MFKIDMTGINWWPSSLPSKKLLKVESTACNFSAIFFSDTLKCGLVGQESCELLGANDSQWCRKGQGHLQVDNGKHQVRWNTSDVQHLRCKVAQRIRNRGGGGGVHIPHDQYFTRKNKPTWVYKNTLKCIPVNTTL